MSALRFIFFKYYGKGINFDSFGLDIVRAFFLGVRYDLAVLGYLNMPVTLAFVALLFYNKEGFYNKISRYVTFYYTIAAQYSNEMLGRFITKIKNSKYARNTIIAVTGDHNFMDCLSYPNERLLDALSVPFYLYIPKDIKPLNIDVSVFGSHLDIMPTLYDISLSNSEYMAMGQSLISDKAKNNIISMDNGVIMSSKGVVEYNFFSEDFSCSVWNKNKYRELLPYSDTLWASGMIKHYLSGIAISEYLIKNTEK
jgi:hypothetical protein